MRRIAEFGNFVLQLRFKLFFPLYGRLLEMSSVPSSFVSPVIAYHNGQISIPYCKGSLYCKFSDLVQLYHQESTSYHNNVHILTSLLETIFTQCTQLLRDLHSNYKSLHGDLHPGNLLINRTGNIVLLQPTVSFSSITSSSQSTANTFPTVFTTVPSGLQNTGASDLFSLGMILYWIASGGVLPFIQEPYLLSNIAIEPTEGKSTISHTMNGFNSTSLIIDQLQQSYAGLNNPTIVPLASVNQWWNKVFRLLLLHPFRAYTLLLQDQLNTTPQLMSTIDQFLFLSPSAPSSKTNVLVAAQSSANEINHQLTPLSPTVVSSLSSLSPKGSGLSPKQITFIEEIFRTEKPLLNTFLNENSTKHDTSIDIDISTAEIEAVLSGSLEDENTGSTVAAPAYRFATSTAVPHSSTSPSFSTLSVPSSSLSPSKQRTPDTVITSPRISRLQRTPPSVVVPLPGDPSNGLTKYTTSMLDNNSSEASNLLRLRQIKKASLINQISTVNTNTTTHTNSSINSSNNGTNELAESILSVSDKAHEEALRLARLATYNERIKLHTQQQQQAKDNKVSTLTTKGNKSGLNRTPPSINVPRATSPIRTNLQGGTSLHGKQVQLSITTESNGKKTNLTDPQLPSNASLLRKLAQAEKATAEREYELQQARIAAFEERKALANRARNVFEPSVPHSVLHAGGSSTSTDNYTSSTRSSSIASLSTNNGGSIPSESYYASSQSYPNPVSSPSAAKSMNNNPSTTTNKTAITPLQLRAQRLATEQATEEAMLQAARIAAFQDRIALKAKYADGRR